MNLEVETRVQGIPCLAKGEGFYIKPRSIDKAHSDIEFYGGWEISQVELFNLKGQRIEWLEKKATETDWARLERELANGARE